MDYSIFIDRQVDFKRQIRHLSVKICNHLHFPYDSQTVSLVACKVSHPEKILCSKCENIPRECGSCGAIYDLGVKAVCEEPDPSRYVIVRTRVFRQYGEEFYGCGEGNAPIDILSSTSIGPFALDSSPVSSSFARGMNAVLKRR
jgi:hypothetical protein